MRDNEWLSQRLSYIHQKHFSDITDGNEIEVRFGRACKTRLGSIAIREKKYRSKRLLQNRLRYLSADEVVSIITINGYFTDPEIPEEVVDAVLAHEFSHFVHGFNSIRDRQYRLPHAGGVITQEFRERGLDGILKSHKKWIKTNWKQIIKK
jgi:hypothetical protein